MSTELFSWVLIMEFVFPFLTLSIVLFVMLLSSRRKLKTKARELIINIKQNEDQEKLAVMRFLQDKLGIAADEAKKRSKIILNERKFLFRNLISALLSGNAEAIALLDQDLSRVTRHYHLLEITPPTAIEPEFNVEEIEAFIALKASNQSLTDANVALKDEIKITLSTLNNIFGEFSSMFGDEPVKEEMSVAQVVDAMGSFSATSVAGASAQSSDTSNSTSPKVDAVGKKEWVDEVLANQKTEDNQVADKQVAENQATSAHTVVSPELEASTSAEIKKESSDLSMDAELDEIDSALDELELGLLDADDDFLGDLDEPSWDDAFAESGDQQEDKQ